MKLSYNWIKEYTDTGEGPEELAERLTMSGSEVVSVTGTGDDTVMELEITSNRPDCLNMTGLAREIAAVSGSRLKLPVMSLPSGTGKGKAPAVRCVIKDKDLCPRYTARVINGVNIRPSGEKIKRRIASVGIRPVNNVVDVTNFCLMETGQPLHAFDLDKIKGREVVVRRAGNNEKIITIDGTERTLKPGMLVIADAEKPIAIAGIMGGRDTEVTEGTRNILLESACFDPVSVRRTSRELGLSSDSSYRFERSVDKGMVGPSSDRAASLIAAEAGGEICDLYDLGEKKVKKKVISFAPDRVERVLRIKIARNEIFRILRKLGMSVEQGGGKAKITVPSFRGDLKGEADLIEEVARIYGYGRIPEDIPKFMPSVERKGLSRKIMEKVRQLMASAGLNEIMTYSLISETSARVFGSLMDEPVRIMNPLSAEQGVLTPHLVDGMLRAVAWNVNRGNKDLALFETGKIYYRRKGETPFGETSALCVGITGNFSADWKNGPRKADIYVLKGVIENLARGLRWDLKITPAEIDGFADTGRVFLCGEETGFIGSVGKDRLEAYGISQEIMIAQIELDTVTGRANLTARYEPVPRFPSACRDISVLCAKSLSAQSIKDVIEDAKEDLVTAVDITDMYEGAQIPPGKKSVTFSIKYGLASRTLTDEEIEASHSRIKARLSEQLGVSFR